MEFLSCHGSWVFQLHCVLVYTIYIHVDCCMHMEYKMSCCARFCFTFNLTMWKPFRFSNDKSWQKYSWTSVCCVVRNKKGWWKKWRKLSICEKVFEYLRTVLKFQYFKLELLAYLRKYWEYLLAISLSLFSLLNYKFNKFMDKKRFTRCITACKKTKCSDKTRTSTDKMHSPSVIVWIQFSELYWIFSFDCFYCTWLTSRARANQKSIKNLMEQYLQRSHHDGAWGA